MRRPTVMFWNCFRFCQLQLTFWDDLRAVFVVRRVTLVDRHDCVCYFRTCLQQLILLAQNLCVLCKKVLKVHDSRLGRFDYDASRLRAVTEMLLSLEAQWLEGVLALRLAIDLILTNRVQKGLRKLLVALWIGLLTPEIIQQITLDLT